ncbi:DEAD/DEAH box helicase [Burkholderiaceae bacterium DAT-1]|nr:DEAD/DEAH box helicase [Burkholderiaceae bacterium DAT-1]
MSFESLGLHPEILRAVLDAGYENPTPVQAAAIPAVLGGRDVMAAAQTGTGKTAAFTLPLLHKLQPHANTSASPARHPVRALILTPTRELCDQVFENVALYSKYLPLRATKVFGGVDMNPQTETLRRGVEVLVATPGRLLDHVQSKSVNLGTVDILVLDEADRMLDMGFILDIRKIIGMLPSHRQTLLFSATFAPEIRKLSADFMRDPVVVEVARRNATNDLVEQHIHEVEDRRKRTVVSQLIKHHNMDQVIVFCKTKQSTDRLARELKREGLNCEAIHGDRTQQARLDTMAAFKDGTLRVLVATDVAARGLDISELPFVVNYELPNNPEDYVHRIGRTGRAGASGIAISLVSPEEEKQLAAIRKLTNKELPVTPAPGGYEPRRYDRSDVSNRHAAVFDGRMHGTPAALGGHSIGPSSVHFPLIAGRTHQREIPALLLPPRYK